MSLQAGLLNRAWRLACLPGARRFTAALADPGRVQRQRVMELVHRHGHSAFGRYHGFTGITTVEAYRAAVPLHNWNQVSPWIERIRAGERQVLSSETVTRLVPTGGSTGGVKLIPWTRGLARDFAAGIAPWVTDLHASVPGVAGGSAYWSISPQIDQMSESVVPVGFDDDSAYLGGALATLVRPLFAVPAALRHVAEVEAFRYATVRCLLARPDLRLLSVWHPSFLALLLDALLDHRQRLIDDLARGGVSLPLPAKVIRAMAPWLRPAPQRAKQLASVDWNNLRNLWPCLSLVSCWADGSAALPAAALQRRMPGIRFQPKGLLATEAAISIPWQGRHVALMTGAVIEFIDAGGNPRWIDELIDGDVYEVALTTGGGLWRYRLGDQVRVEGFVQRTPCLRFCGRVGVVCDLVGEKLDEGFVAGCLTAVIGSADFAMLAPNADGGAGYTLFSDCQMVSEDLARLDLALSLNPHWALARRLGQLLPLQAKIVSADAAAIWIRHRATTSQGAVKPCALVADRGWEKLLMTGQR